MGHARAARPRPCHADRASWQPWTRAFVSDRNSFTEVEVEGRTLHLRQLDAKGRELDAITLTK